MAVFYQMKNYFFELQLNYNQREQQVFLIKNIEHTENKIIYCVEQNFALPAAISDVLIPSKMESICAVASKLSSELRQI